MPLSAGTSARYREVPLSSAFFKSLFRKSLRNRARAGIAFGEGVLALAMVRREDGAKPTIEYCATQPVGGDVGALLRSTLEKLQATRAAASAVISSNDY